MEVRYPAGSSQVAIVDESSKPGKGPYVPEFWYTRVVYE